MSTSPTAGPRVGANFVDNFQLHVVAESVHLVTYLAALQEFGVPTAKVRDALLNHPGLSGLATRAVQVNNLGENDLIR